MMIFPETFEQKLGFDAIRRALSENCLCSSGRSRVGKIVFSADYSLITSLLEQTEEFRQLLLSNDPFPSQDYMDLTGELNRISLEGTFIDPENLAFLKTSLVVISEIISFFRSDNKEKYKRLGELAEGLVVDKNIIRRVDKIIDERGLIRDEASPELKRIRKDRIVKQSTVEKKIKEKLKIALKSGWTPDDAGVTVRNGRLVIPLLTSYKRQIPGFVHDESATGQTVYLEPAEVLEINNEIRELDYAERREIVRILTDFTIFIRPQIPGLILAYDFLGTIDFIRAKALYAVETGAALSKVILDKPHLKWSGAVHPLLFLSHRHHSKIVVPLSIELNDNQRILVISGPNAGGKSVCLKTTGLLQYMLQSGLLVPVDESSEMGLFQSIFIDIGDEQSLENDLSTYTSKLMNLKFFINHLDKNSLFLIDELGTGTDPSLGGTIAEASLEKINKSKAFGVVTTHYSNLKTLAGKTPGIVNGAMLFDSEKMIPLYQLMTGQPGSSFAFEIAGQIGFPEDVLKNAAEKTGQSQLDFDRQIRNLETEKSEVIKKADEFKVADSFLQDVIRKYQDLTADLEKNRKEILLKAKEEARELVEKSNKLIEKTIKEIRENQAEKSKTKKAREELNGLKEKLAPDKPAAQPITNPPTHQLTSLSSHQLASSPAHQLTTDLPRKTYLDDLNNKLRDFQLNLDIRGYRADEAFAAVQRYIDDAVMLGITEVRILHGKGNGVLRQVTREYLASVKEIKAFKDEALERGGAGITLVTFR